MIAAAKMDARTIRSMAYWAVSCGLHVALSIKLEILVGSTLYEPYAIIYFRWYFEDSRSNHLLLTSTNKCVNVWVSECLCVCLCVFVCRQHDFDRLRTSDLNLNQSRSKYYNRSLALVYDNDLPIVVAFVVVVVGTHTQQTPQIGVDDDTWESKVHDDALHS